MIHSPLEGMTEYYKVHAWRKASTIPSPFPVEQTLFAKATVFGILRDGLIRSK